MSKFINKGIVNYPVEQVYDLFIQQAQNEFESFDINHPIGTKVRKRVGAYSTKQGVMEVEITNFIRNEIYEITSINAGQSYKSTYSFAKLNANQCEITLEESDLSAGVFKSFNAFIVSKMYKSRVKKRFSYFLKNLETQLQKG